MRRFGSGILKQEKSPWQCPWLTFTVPCVTSKDSRPHPITGGLWTALIISVHPHHLMRGWIISKSCRKNARVVWNLEHFLGRDKSIPTFTGEINSVFDDDKPSIPIGLASGNWGAWRLMETGKTIENNKFYGTRGNSFVAVVEFGDRVKAKSLLAGGQNNNPESPHFDDQAQRYADAEFKNVAYYREDVEARAVSRYHPGVDK